MAVNWPSPRHGCLWLSHGEDGEKPLWRNVFCLPHLLPVLIPNSDLKDNKAAHTTAFTPWQALF